MSTLTMLQENCGICLEPLPLNTHDPAIWQLECNHSFHRHCLLRHLQIHVEPIRRTLASEDEVPRKVTGLTVTLSTNTTFSISEELFTRGVDVRGRYTFAVSDLVGAMENRTERQRRAAEVETNRRQAQ